MNENGSSHRGDPTSDRSGRQPVVEPRWRMEDLIDFEYLLESDREKDGADLERRDHEIFHSHIHPHMAASGESLCLDRRWLFRQWLEARRQTQADDPAWPGKVYRASWRLLTHGLAAGGFMIGAGAAAHLLRYAGVQPVNVAAYLGWLVLLQMALVAGAVGVFGLRKSRLLATEISLLTGLVRWAWTSLARRLSQRTLDQIPAAKRQQFLALGGALQVKTILYGPVMVWPLVGRLQLLGVFFNLGVISVTLALVVFSDRAFGWQSAVDFSAAQVHRLVQLVAVPWAWLFPAGVGAPTLPQIEGSRIILKDGIRQLATENLVSWWPFLCLSAATYGLLPRVGLLFLSWMQSARALGNLSFNHVAGDRLYERLLSEDLQTQGIGEPSASGAQPGKTMTSATAGSESQKRAYQAQGALLLLEPEMLESIEEAPLRQAILDRFHVEVSRCQPTGFNPLDLGRTLSEWTPGRGENEAPHLVWMHEAWQPPIAENLDALRWLRNRLGKSARIIVLLVGRPTDGSVWSAVNASDWRNWERGLTALGDPMLRWEALTSHA